MPDDASPLQQAQWYVFDGRQRLGPYLRSELITRLQTGTLGDDALFSCGGPWVSRTDVEQLLADQDAAVLLEPEEGPTSRSWEPKPEALSLADGAAGPTATPALKISLEHGGGSAELTAEAPAPQTAGWNLNNAAWDPAAELQTPARDLQDEQHIPDAGLPARDRIVVIGRRSSGKTVYLATLYHHLWKSRDGLSMKALSGRAHTELTRSYEILRHGEWPAATQKETVHQMEFELEYRGCKRILVGLDYAGEIFRDAFVNDDASSPQARALVSHIDRAMAVILLVDPAIAIGDDPDAQIDDDFGMVQAIQRIRDWPGGEDVPVVLLLTKADQNRHLFKDKEATRQFVATNYPALLRTLKNFKVFHASAVQTTRDEQGRPRPKGDSVQMNILESLRYCLDVLDAEDERKRLQQQEAAEQRAMQRLIDYQAEAERRSNKRLAIVVGSIITIGICILVLVLVFAS